MFYQRNCPVCHSSKSEKLLFCKEFPYFTVPVSKSDKEVILKSYKKRDLAAPLDVRVCNNCCHCFIAKLPDQKTINSLYKKYYSYPSPLKGGFKPERDDAFLRIFEELLQPLCRRRGLNKILEVGCYDGYILYHLQEKGFEVMGCDPSEGADVGRGYGVTILKDFFDGKKFLKKNMSFDIVISRHFTEHLSTPGKWISGLLKILKQNGLIIIEVPNVEFYIEKGLCEVFSLQHLQGFTSASLYNLLIQQKLTVIDVLKTSNNLLAIAELGKGEGFKKIESWKQTIKSFNAKLNENKHALEEIIKKYSAEKKIICLWGAGGFGLAALTMYGISAELICFIVDSDPQKWGMEYVNYSIPVISPKEAFEAMPDLIIVASMYNDSIIKTIIDKKFASRVLTIFPTVKLV